MSDPVGRFVDIARAHERCFWLDGGGSRPWSGRRSLLGWLEDDDVSLRYDAARGRVTRHASGRAELAGADIFEVLADHLVDDPPDVHWVGYFGYASRPDLPALLAPDGELPDALWMRTRHVQVFHHPDSDASLLPPSGRRPPERPVPPV
jgi:para-aminobenzoate synthetase